MQDEAKRIPHYGLRKLSVGVASVLLGTTLFFGVSAQADTTTGQVGNGSDTESENDNANKLADAKKVVLSQVTTTNTLNTIKTPAAQNTESLAENKSATTTKPQPSMDNEGVSVTLNRPEYNPQDGQAVQLTAQIHAQAGDKISFVIPQGAYQQPSYASLNSTSGTTTSTNQSDGSTLITDQFTAGGTFSQTISLQPYPYELNINHLCSAGTTLIPVIIQKNGNEIGRVSFNQTIKPTMAPTFQRTKLSSQSVGKLAPNVDYQWTLDFNETPGTTANSSRSVGPSKSINHGTTVTIPVPQGFVLNKTASEDLSKSKFGDMHWTASQIDGPGSDVVFVSHDGYSNFPAPITLVGHFTNQLTESSQKVTASRQISIVQDTGNGTQLTETLPPFTDQLMSKSEDNPQGDIFKGKVYRAYGGGLDKYDLGEVPLSQNPDSIAFWKYEVGNASAFNLTNVPVNIMLPDGMKPTKLVLPTDYDSGKITYTLHRYVDVDHPDEITNGVLNPGQTTIDFSNLAGNVRSIQLTLATLDSGVDYTGSDYSTSDGFKAYGYVSQKYANGTDVKVGDQLTSNLTIGNSGQGWSKDQYVVAKKVQPISVKNYPYQTKTAPGAQMSGQLGLLWNNTYSNSDFVNPTIYYVLPLNASFNSYSPISSKANITSYKAKDGRTIVKVTYHNTTSQDFNYYGDSLYLNNSADLPHSTSNYKIYLVAPDGMQVTGSDKVSSADLQYVENNTNAYLVGSGNWIIESAKGTQIAEQSRGNKNADLTLAGESDNHGSNKMTYTGSVINNTNNKLNNVAYDLNLPDTADGNSGFNFYLDEPVTVIDAATGKSLAGIQVKYSTTRVNLSENGQPTGGNFGTLPANIHQVRAVQVLLPSISIGQSVRVILNGIDPTIINDVNKTGYLSSSLYTTDNSLKPINVLPNSTNASSIKVTGSLDKQQKITVNYIDKVTGQQLDSKSMSGLSGADTHYTTQSSIDKYVGKHYVLYQDETKGADLVYDNDSSKDQVYNVYFTHGTQDTTGNKTVHETIHYVYGLNQPRSGQAAADKTAEVTFTRKGTTDLVTGKTTWQDWDQKNQSFAAVTSPTIAGYTADQAQIDKQTVTGKDQDIEKTVIYTASPEIPNPSRPNVPNSEDKLKETDSQNASSFKGKSNNEHANNKQQLPQTGNDSSRELGIVGLALTSMVSLLGLPGFKKKHD